MLLNKVDALNAKFAADLDAVLTDIENSIISIVGSSSAGKDAVALLNSQPAMIAALAEAGYKDLAAKHVAAYEQIVEAVAADLSAKGIPVAFNTASVELFQQIAKADLEQFDVIGKKAADDLRRELYRYSISSRPFEDMVEVIRNSIGPDSPFARYAYTYANTAALQFSGQVVINAGENLGVDRWEVLGPDDAATRDVCLNALADPIRTKRQWISAGYWGGTPGGWNCRHILYPYFR